MTTRANLELLKKKWFCRGAFYCFSNGIMMYLFKSFECVMSLHHHFHSTVIFFSNIPHSYRGFIENTRHSKSVRFFLDTSECWSAGVSECMPSYHPNIQKNPIAICWKCKSFFCLHYCHKLTYSLIHFFAAEFFLKLIFVWKMDILGCKVELKKTQWSKFHGIQIWIKC